MFFNQKERTNRNERSYLQINVYGSSLAVLRRKGVDVKQLLACVGLTDCVLHDVPLGRESENHLSSTNAPLANESSHNARSSFISSESRFTNKNPARSSTPLAACFKDEHVPLEESGSEANLINCSLSSIGLSDFSDDGLVAPDISNSTVVFKPETVYSGTITGDLPLLQTNAPLTLDDVMEREQANNILRVNSMRRYVDQYPTFSSRMERMEIIKPEPVEDSGPSTEYVGSNPISSIENRPSVMRKLLAISSKSIPSRDHGEHCVDQRCTGTLHKVASADSISPNNNSVLNTEMPDLVAENSIERNGCESEEMLIVDQTKKISHGAVCDAYEVGKHFPNGDGQNFARHTPEPKSLNWAKIISMEHLDADFNSSLNKSDEAPDCTTTPYSKPADSCYQTGENGEVNAPTTSFFSLKNANPLIYKSHLARSESDGEKFAEAAEAQSFVEFPHRPLMDQYRCNLLQPFSPLESNCCSPRSVKPMDEMADCSDRMKRDIGDDDLKPEDHFAFDQGENCSHASLSLYVNKRRVKSNVSKYSGSQTGSLLRGRIAKPRMSASGKPSNDSDPILFICQFLDCGAPLSWKPRWGKTRLIEHVQRHMNSYQVRCTVKDCEFAGRSARVVREHHRTNHFDTKWINPLHAQNDEEFEELKNLWMICFPVLMRSNPPLDMDQIGRNILSYVQINVYGTTLKELLLKGVNIEHLLSSIGIADCIMLDVPLSKYKSSMDASDLRGTPHPHSTFNFINSISRLVKCEYASSQSIQSDFPDMNGEEELPDDSSNNRDVKNNLMNCSLSTIHSFGEEESINRGLLCTDNNIGNVYSEAENMEDLTSSGREASRHMSEDVTLNLAQITERDLGNNDLVSDQIRADKVYSIGSPAYCNATDDLRFAHDTALTGTARECDDTQVLSDVNHTVRVSPVMLTRSNSLSVNDGNDDFVNDDDDDFHDCSTGAPVAFATNEQPKSQSVTVCGPNSCPLVVPLQREHHDLYCEDNAQLNLVKVGGFTADNDFDGDFSINPTCISPTGYVGSMINGSCLDSHDNCRAPSIEHPLEMAPAPYWGYPIVNNIEQSDIFRDNDSAGAFEDDCNGSVLAVENVTEAVDSSFQENNDNLKDIAAPNCAPTYITLVPARDFRWQNGTCETSSGRTELVADFGIVQNVTEVFEPIELRPDRGGSNNSVTDNADKDNLHHCQLDSGPCMHETDDRLMNVTGTSTTCMKPDKLQAKKRIRNSKTKGNVKPIKKRRVNVNVANSEFDADMVDDKNCMDDRSGDEQFKVFACQFEGCDSQFNWKPRWGKMRLLEHVRSHMREKKINCRAPGCEYTARTIRSIRNHHRTSHPDRKWVNPIYAQNADDVEGYRTVWQLCYPGTPVTGASAQHYVSAFSRNINNTINVYGTTLNELLQKGVNIENLLSGIGVTDCVILDVPLSKHKLCTNATAVRTKSPMNSSFNFLGSTLSVKREYTSSGPSESGIDDEDELQDRCSELHRSEDNLVNCSLSTISHDFHEEEAIKKSLDCTFRKVGTICSEVDLNSLHLTPSVHESFPELCNDETINLALVPQNQLAVPDLISEQVLEVIDSISSEVKGGSTGNLGIVEEIGRLDSAKISDDTQVMTNDGNDPANVFTSPVVVPLSTPTNIHEDDDFFDCSTGAIDEFIPMEQVKSQLVTSFEHLSCISNENDDAHAQANIECVRESPEESDVINNILMQNLNMFDIDVYQHEARVCIDTVLVPFKHDFSCQENLQISPFFGETNVTNNVPYTTDPALDDLSANVACIAPTECLDSLVDVSRADNNGKCLSSTTNPLAAPTQIVSSESTNQNINNEESLKCHENDSANFVEDQDEPCETSYQGNIDYMDDSAECDISTTFAPAQVSRSESSSGVKDIELINDFCIVQNVETGLSPCELGTARSDCLNNSIIDNAADEDLNNYHGDTEPCVLERCEQAINETTSETSDAPPKKRRRVSKTAPCSEPIERTKRKRFIKVKTDSCEPDVCVDDADGSKTFVCQFPGCGVPLKWKPRWGKMRLLEHVRRHSPEYKIQCPFPNCDYKHSLFRQVRYHHLTKHANTPWTTPAKPAKTEDFEQFKKIWNTCYPDVPQRLQMTGWQLAAIYL